MRKNTPLSTYIRGASFFDWRIYEVDGKIPASAMGRARETHQRLEEMKRFDSVCFSPLIALGRDVYKETPLEDKLTSMMNKFEAGGKRLYTSLDDAKKDPTLVTDLVTLA